MTDGPDPTSQRGSELLYHFLNLGGEPESLVNTIVLTTAREIIEGRVSPGAPIDSLNLAKRYQTSRTPVREALIALQRQGLVDIEPRRRPRVSVLSKQQIREIYELRAELHTLVARKVVANLNAQSLELLSNRINTMRQASERGDVDDYFWANVEFHDLAANIAGDMTLKRVIYGLGLQVLRLRHAGMAVPGRMERSATDHLRLLLAYQEADADLAAALSRSLVLGGLAALGATPEL
jgi:DNA-binding GntR family transcriptional regulator